MAYASVEYEFWCNPKIRAAGKDAALLYIAANGYCNQFMTDGFILDESIDAIASLAFQRNPNKAIDALVENGLWHRVNGGYEVHDYLKYNKSKAQIESLSEKRSNAGKAGADMRNKSSEDATANATANAQQLPEQLNGSILLSLKDLKESTTTTAREEISEVVKAYESEIGVLTGTVREKLVAALDEYPADWIIKAFEESALQNARNWKYAEAILKRWKAEGFKSDKRQKNGYKKQTDTKSDIPGYISDRSNEVVVYD